MNDFMSGIFGLNWRTTLAGIIGATAYIVMDYVGGKMDTKTFVVAFIVAAAGFVAKDAKVTGNPTNPRAQALGQPTPILSPEAKVEIKEIEEKKRTEE